MKSAKLTILIIALLAITAFMYLSDEFDSGGSKKGTGTTGTGTAVTSPGKLPLPGAKVRSANFRRGQNDPKRHVADQDGLGRDHGSGNLEDLDHWLNEGDAGQDSSADRVAGAGGHVDSQMTPEDMQNELDYVLQIEDPGDRRQAMLELGKTMGFRADPEMVTEFLQSLPEDNDKVTFLVGYIKTMVDTKNPEAVAQVLADVGDEKLTSTLTPLLASRWASKDLQGAFNWAAQITDPRNQDSAMVRIGRVFALSDPEGAVQWATQFENKVVGNNIMNYAVQRWAIKDPGSAAVWAGNMPEGNERERMINAVAVTWTRRDPAAAADWVIKNDTSANRDNVLAGIASAWSRQDPEQASKWAVQFPNPQARDRALLQTSYQWAKRDPVTAAEWAGSLAAEQGQQRALSGVATGWAVKDPTSAANWADGIRDTATRNLLQEQVARQWLNRDREQATQWIIDSDLPDVAKKRLLP